MSYPVYIKPGKDYVFCNEDLEPTFERQELELITSMWNEGEDILTIANRIERDPDEVFLAIFHQARHEKIERKLQVVGGIYHG